MPLHTLTVLVVACFIVHLCTVLTGKEVAGKVSLRHIYEIAVVKSQDPTWQNMPLETVCKSIIGSAHTIGIEVVRHLDTEEYGDFLQERRRIVDEQEQELKDSRAAKLLRVS